MTDVRFTGSRRGLPRLPRRGLPLAPEPNVFDLIAGDNPELRNEANGEPNLSAIARIADVNYQRLFEARSALRDDSTAGPYLGVHMLGALVRCYAVVHGVDDKTAAATILRVDDSVDRAMECAA